MELIECNHMCRCYIVSNQLNYWLWLVFFEEAIGFDLFINYHLKNWLCSPMVNFFQHLFFSLRCFTLCWGWVVFMYNSFGSPTSEGQWYWLDQALALLLPLTLLSIIQKLYVPSNNFTSWYPPRHSLWKDSSLK